MRPRYVRVLVIRADGRGFQAVHSAVSDIEHDTAGSASITYCEEAKIPLWRIIVGAQL